MGGFQDQDIIQVDKGGWVDEIPKDIISPCQEGLKG